ncbi:MAG: 1-acyl-sn-glycerol-3-phosphate acyltransferase [Bacteroidales bacterium]
MSESVPARIDVKNVLRDKNPALARVIPGFLVNYLRRIIHEDELNEFFAKYGHLKDIDLVKAGIDFLGISYTVHNPENIPRSGRYIFTSNHPLGGLDGTVFMLELSKYYENVKFPVNDILMNIGNMSGIFLPVNKHGGQEREAVRLIDEAYASDSQILYFPAGLCSRKKKGKIEDLVWQKSVVVKAVRHKRDIVPVFFSGRNSGFFYNLANLRVALGIKSNFEMLYLPDEMFKQKDKEIHLVFGETIPWQTFDRSKPALEWAAWLKQKSYDLESVIK